MVSACGSTVVSVSVPASHTRRYETRTIVPRQQGDTCPKGGTRQLYSTEYINARLFNLYEWGLGKMNA